jgi:hypothetical protein
MTGFVLAAFAGVGLGGADAAAGFAGAGAGAVARASLVCAQAADGSSAALTTMAAIHLAPNRSAGDGLFGGLP